MHWFQILYRLASFSYSLFHWLIFFNFQNEIADLKREIEAKEKNIEKFREEGLDERRSWVQQIEENRLRHLDDVEALKQKHKQFISKQESEHKDAMDAAVIQLKEEHRQELVS